MFQHWDDTPPRYPMFAPCSALIWFSSLITFVPGGTVGFSLQLYAPKNYAYTNIIGFVREVRKIFMVISACFTIQNNIKIGKLLSTDARPATK